MSGILKSDAIYRNKFVANVENNHASHKDETEETEQSDVFNLMLQNP